MLRDFNLAVKLLAILIFLQLLIGYDAMLISSLLRVDAYPPMNMIFMVSSFIDVGVLYLELLRPLAHAAKPKTLEFTGLEFMLIRYDVEEDYASTLKSILKKLSEKLKLIILARRESPLLADEDINGVKIALTMISLAPAHQANMLPANNLPLIASTIISMTRKEPSCIVIDDLTSLIVVNTIKEVYTFLYR